MPSDMIIDYLADDFERNLFEAAKSNLADEDNKLRFNNFSYAMRELTRHILYRMAPKESVISCSWFKPTPNATDGITRRDRAKYAVQGGMSDQYVRDKLGFDSDVMYKSLIAAIGQLSKFTHIERETFGLDRATVDQFARETLDAVEALFGTIKDHRAELISRLYRRIDRMVLDQALLTAIETIDVLSTHQHVDSLGLEDVVVTSISHERIHLKASGNVDCTLYYGSASDRRNGEGATIEDSYPFTCRLSCPVDDPRAVVIEPNGLHVDISSWYAESNENIDDPGVPSERSPRLVHPRDFE